jgi:hypothetical protein
VILTLLSPDDILPFSNIYKNAKKQKIMKVIKDESKRSSIKNKCASLPATKNAREPALIQIGGESLSSNKVKFGRIPPYDSLTR